jgi:Xaa-Pro aminopeptidase
MDQILATTKFSKPLYENAAKSFVEGYRRRATGAAPTGANAAAGRGAAGAGRGANAGGGAPPAGAPAAAGRGGGGGGGNLGHAVGMATHDFGGGSGMMRPGMVFTIEPEFRIPEEQIFIRLEDMIVITESGAKITSDFVPRSIAAVEKMVAEPGILQAYKKIK